MKIFGGLKGDKLKVAPKGYLKDHIQVQWLRYKDSTVIKNVNDEELQFGKCFDTSYDVYYQMADFNFLFAKSNQTIIKYCIQPNFCLCVLN